MSSYNERIDNMRDEWREAENLVKVLQLKLKHAIERNEAARLICQQLEAESKEAKSNL